MQTERRDDDSRAGHRSMTDAAAAAPRDRSSLTVRRQPRGAARRRVARASSAARIHVIVGPNGAGKSTLLAAMLGADCLRRAASSLQLERRPARSATCRRASRSIRRCRSRSRIFSRSRVSGGRSASASARRPRADVARLLDRVGLAGLERRPLAVLSGGELRRVLLAHALDPDAGAARFSTSRPAASTRRRCAWLEETPRALKRRGQTTVLMVSHDLEQVRRIADRVTVLDRRIVAEGRRPRSSAPPACASCCRRRRTRRRAHDRLLQLGRRRWRSRACCRATSSIRF